MFVIEIFKINIKKIITMELFTKKNLGVFVTVLAAVMVGLAVHQTMVAPRLAKK